MLRGLCLFLYNIILIFIFDTPCYVRVEPELHRYVEFRLNVDITYFHGQYHCVHITRAILALKGFFLLETSTICEHSKIWQLINRSRFPILLQLQLRLLATTVTVDVRTTDIITDIHSKWFNNLTQVVKNVRFFCSLFVAENRWKRLSLSAACDKRTQHTTANHWCRGWLLCRR